LEQGLRGIVARGPHADGTEDAFLEHRGVALPRDLLDDGAQQEIPGVVVAVLRARVELELALQYFSTKSRTS
jgi:hypothetical protein